MQGLLAFLPIMLGNVVLLVVVAGGDGDPVAAAHAGRAWPRLPLLLVVSLRLRSRVFPATWDAQQRAGEVAGVVDEAVTGVRVVKGFGQEERELDHLADVATGPLLVPGPAGAAAGPVHLRRCRPSRRSAQVGGARPRRLAGARAASITLGTFLAFSTYLVQLVAPVRMLAGLFTVGAAGPGRRRARPRPPRRQRRGGRRAARRHRAARRPAARCASTTCASATPRSEPVLDGLDLHVAPGETVALVGTQRLGQVDGHRCCCPASTTSPRAGSPSTAYDVRDVTLESLRRQVGLVFEDTFLFSDTVRANIAYGRPDATDAEVDAAAAAAGAHDVHRGAARRATTPWSASGASRSPAGSASASPWPGRCSPTRASWCSTTPPRRSTSATEEAIHDTLRELMAGRTTILIAHRRSTLRLADRIVVLDAGRVVAEGTHEELLELAAPSTATCSPAPTTSTSTRRRRRPRRRGPGRRCAEPVLVGAGDHRVGVAGAGRRRRAGGPATVDAAPRIGSPGGGGGGGGGRWAWRSPPRPSCSPRSPPCPRPTTCPTSTSAAAAASDPPPFLRAPVRAAVAALAARSGSASSRSTRSLTLLGPALVRRGIDSGVTADDPSGLWTSVGPVRSWSALVDWGVMWAYTAVTGRTAERALFALRVKIFAHLQRLVARLLRRASSTAGS